MTGPTNAVLYIGLSLTGLSLSGFLYINPDIFRMFGSDNTQEAGLKEGLTLQEMTDMQKAKLAGSNDGMETGLEMSKPPVIDKNKLQEYINQEVQKKIKELCEVDSSVQVYQQGETRVLTPELLEAMIASSMDSVIDKHNEEVQEKINKQNEQLQEKMDKHNELLQKKMDKHNELLQKKIDKLSEQKYSANLDTIFIDYIPVIIIICVSFALDMYFFRSIYRWVALPLYGLLLFIMRKDNKREKLPSKEKRDLKKLEDSICLVSFSSDYVEKYHVPLAKSLIEYSNWKDLRLKRAIISEPESLRFIPPSKIFMVFVDYNERNDLLEKDGSKQKQMDPKLKQVPIRRETVRSLMDSLGNTGISFWQRMFENM